MNHFLIYLILFLCVNDYFAIPLNAKLFKSTKTSRSVDPYEKSTRRLFLNKKNKPLSNDLPKRNLPNIILFHVDDLGYGDLNMNGHPTTYTPNIDKLYTNGGIRFQQAITPDSVCTPNRASILTGRYPIRMGFAHNFNRVIYDPGMPSLIPTNETTIAQQLKQVGYSNAIFGKWHLGLNINHHNDSMALPLQYGFDYYYGVPFGANPYNIPDNQNPPYAASTLYLNNRLIQQPVDMYSFTKNMNEQIIDWIDRTVLLNQPMMIHVNYLQVHTPLFASIEFQNKSHRGAFGDDLLELDDSIGQIVTHMREIGLDDNTLYILTSDNGPYGEELVDGGDHGLFRGNKGQTWEGGHRVPLIMRYKNLMSGTDRMINRIYYDPVSTMDIYPTILNIVGLEYNSSQIDGQFIDLKAIYNQNDPLIKTESNRTFFYYCGERVLGIRYGVYKIHLYTQKWKDSVTQTCSYASGWEFGVCDCTDRIVEEADPPLMYNIEHDPGERYSFTPENFPEYHEILSTALIELNKHTQSIIVVENQLDKEPDTDLYPCCNYPLCCCNSTMCE
jgi:arylsulfatase A